MDLPPHVLCRKTQGKPELLPGVDYCKKKGGCMDLIGQQLCIGVARSRVGVSRLVGNGARKFQGTVVFFDVGLGVVRSSGRVLD